MRFADGGRDGPSPEPPWDDELTTDKSGVGSPASGLARTPMPMTSSVRWASKPRARSRGRSDEYILPVVSTLLNISGCRWHHHVDTITMRRDRLIGGGAIMRPVGPSSGQSGHQSDREAAPPGTGRSRQDPRHNHSAVGIDQQMQLARFAPCIAFSHWPATSICRPVPSINTYN